MIIMNLHILTVIVKAASRGTSAAAEWGFY